MSAIKIYQVNNFFSLSEDFPVIHEENLKGLSSLLFKKEKEYDIQSHLGEGKRTFQWKELMSSFIAVKTSHHRCSSVTPTIYQFCALINLHALQGWTEFNMAVVRWASPPFS